MKNFLTFIFSLFFISGGLLLSCKSKSVPDERKETIIYKTEHLKDTVLVVEKDSSYYNAFIDCVNGKPVLVQSQNQIKDFNTKNPTQLATAPKSIAGRSVKPPSVSLNNAVLSINCEKEAEKLFFAWKETELREWQISQKPVYIDRKLTTFQNVKMFLGNIFFYALCLAIVAIAIRFFLFQKK
jgi:hypothetical protein